MTTLALAALDAIEAALLVAHDDTEGATHALITDALAVLALEREAGRAGSAVPNAQTLTP